MVAAMGNGAVGSWDSSVIVEGKEGETAGVTERRDEVQRLE